MNQIIKAISTFFLGEKDVVKSAMRKYGAKTEEELFAILNKNTIQTVQNIFDLETSSKYKVTEIKEVLNITYSDEKYSKAMQLIKAEDVESVANLNETLFIPTGNYLRFYQILTTENKVFVMAVIYPYEPYQATESLWLYELPRKLWLS